MTEFWGRQRLLDHLRRSVSCRQYVLALLALDAQLIARLDREATEATRTNRSLGRHTNWAAVPATMLYGPRPLQERVA